MIKNKYKWNENKNAITSGEVIKSELIFRERERKKNGGEWFHKDDNNNDCYR